MARSLPVEILYYHRMLGQLSTTCWNLLKQPKWELLVAIDHIRRRRMASETVYPTDWSHPPSSWAVPSAERLVYSKNRCSSATVGIRSCYLATFSMRGNHLAYAATQGIKTLICFIQIFIRFYLQFKFYIITVICHNSYLFLSFN